MRRCEVLLGWGTCVERGGRRNSMCDLQVAGWLGVFFGLGRRVSNSREQKEQVRSIR